MSTATRSQLKVYFGSNCIPTASNFSDLIDSMLNQTDDGIVKSSGHPLAISAETDTTTPQQVLNLFVTMGDANPAWTLLLNPRSQQNDSSTGNPGFSISDATGTSQLFIEQSSNNIGLGTITPKAKLDVNGNANVSGPLTVGGAAIFNNTLKVTNAANFTNTKSSISTDLTVGGNATFGLSLKVTGAASFNSATISNALTVGGDATFGLSLIVTDAATGTDVANFNSKLSTIGNELSVGGNATFNQSLIVAGVANFNSEQSTISNDLNVAGNATFGQTLIVNNVASFKNALSLISNPFEVDGVATLNNTLTVTGAATLNNTLTVTGTATLNNTLTVTGAATLNNTLTVTGAATFDKTVEVKGDLTVDGSFVNGSFKGNISSPKWAVHKVMNLKPGSLPVTSDTFNTSGGSLLIFVSGSVSYSGPAQIGMNVLLDGVSIGTVQMGVNVYDVHTCMPSNMFYESSVSVGSHTIMLSPIGDTYSDNNDLFNIMVMELPF